MMFILLELNDIISKLIYVFIINTDFTIYLYITQCQF